MEDMSPYDDKRASLYFKRPRLNQLFEEAVKYPLVVVCAGAGYGKTSAVHDFAQEYHATVFWLQLSERDNTSARFWESYIHALTKINAPLAEALTKMGFPDTNEKMNHYQSLLNDLVEKKRRIIVMDDFHCIAEPSVVRFIEECIIFKMPPGTSVFLVSRTLPDIKSANSGYEKKIFNISEDDLRFTESELTQYFRSRNISPSYENLREIMQDTGGWAFAVNFIAQSFQKAPGYSGYVRNALRTNIFGMIDTEIWKDISVPLQNFLLRLSLIDHLSIDLINQLAGDDSNLIPEFEKLNAYVRRDNYINAYFIHPLFLEFVRTKQDSLSEEQKKETYAVSGSWCARNGFRIDAISYYEKTGDYKSIVSILDEFSAQMPQNIAQYVAPVLDKAPEDAFDKVKYLAEMHLRAYMCQGLWKKSIELVKNYEEKFLKLPENDARNRTLAQLYVCWGYLRALISTTDNNLDFAIFMEKANKCVSTLEDPGKFGPYYSGAWVNYNSSPKKGSPQEFIDVLIHIKKNMQSDFLKGIMAGEIELIQGELEFFRGEVNAALPLLNLAIKEAQAEKQPGFVFTALFYILRIAVSQGNFIMAEQTLKDIKAQLDEPLNINRFINNDIALSWYYCYLGFPEKIADCFKEDFSPYIHAAFIENFGNQIKARFCYATRNFAPLLSYIEEMKTRESILFGRIEMLALEACVHYKQKNKEKAFAAFEEAYKNAEPNGILMPFIELGKDMRTLASAMLKESKKVIPASWLEDINHKSATYAKRRSHVVAKYTQSSGSAGGIVLSPRETEILNDISHGLSRAEIAASRKLSINTIKMIINKIHNKLGAENLADLIRIAVERKLIS
jgi:LuxR family transcriptional regulator, maltose regulon positive regulatory protein